MVKSCGPIRIAVLGALMIAGVVVVPAMASAAPPAPPYNDWTLNGGQASYLLAPGEAFRWTPTTGMTEGAYGTSGLEFSGPGALTIWTALIAAPTGGLLHVGTYTTQRGADATHIGLDIDGDGRGCNQDSGTLDIEQVTYDDSNAITAHSRRPSANSAKALNSPLLANSGSTPRSYQGRPHHRLRAALTSALCRSACRRRRPSR